MNLKQVLSANNVEPLLIELIEVIAQECQFIATQLRLGDLGDALGSHHTENVQGEVQKKLDVIANNCLKTALLKLPQVAAIASEEEDGSVTNQHLGDYLVAFDPLDGSSNIDINAQTGTIFGIYPRSKAFKTEDERQFLQPGKNQICSGYVLYSSATVLVINWGQGNQVFSLNPRTENFEYVDAKIFLPKRTQEFAINVSNQEFWPRFIQQYISDLLLGKFGTRQTAFNMRWNGAMVGDVHRVLLRGGIFLYPEDSKNSKQPAKLRLLYEANPIAKLIEAAGGVAHTGVESILEVQPVELHQRVGVILGSADEVNCCLSYRN